MIVSYLSIFTIAVAELWDFVHLKKNAYYHMSDSILSLLWANFLKDLQNPRIDKYTVPFDFEDYHVCPCKLWDFIIQ
jgi:hypothetical protein